MGGGSVGGFLQDDETDGPVDQRTQVRGGHHGTVFQHGKELGEAVLQQAVVEDGGVRRRELLDAVSGVRVVGQHGNVLGGPRRTTCHYRTKAHKRTELHRARITSTCTTQPRVLSQSLHTTYRHIGALLQAQTVQLCSRC